MSEEQGKKHLNPDGTGYVEQATPTDDVPKDAGAEKTARREDAERIQTAVKMMGSLKYLTERIKLSIDREQIRTQPDYQNMVVLSQRMQPKGETEFSADVVGKPIESLDLALIFIDDQGHRLIDHQKELSEEETISFERGLGMSLIHSLVEMFDLKGDDIDLNQLKKSYDSIISKSSPDVEAVKDLDAEQKQADAAPNKEDAESTKEK